MFPELKQNQTNPEAAIHTGKLDHFLSNQQNIMQEFQEVRQSLQTIRNEQIQDHERELILKKQQQFQQKIQGVQSACTFLEALGASNGNHGLQTAAITGSAVTQMYSGGMALMSGPLSLASLHPAAMVGMGALTLFQTLGKKRNRGNQGAMQTFMAQMQLLAQAVYHMHSEMRQSFEINFENQRILLETVVHGFENLERVIVSEMQRVEAITIQRLDRTEATINRIGRMLADGQEIITLQSFSETLSRADAQIEGTSIQDRAGKCEEIARLLTDWIKIKGRASLSMHTGARWLPRDRQADFYSAISDILKEVNSQSVTDFLGFLAYYAHYHLKINLANTSEDSSDLIEGVFNPNLWLTAGTRYVELRKEFGKYVPDPDHININRILQAATYQQRFMQSLRTKHDLYETLFNQYQSAINDLKDIINASFAKQSTAIGVDILKNIEDVIVEIGPLQLEDRIIGGKFNHTYWRDIDRGNVAWCTAHYPPNYQLTDFTFTEAGLDNKNLPFNIQQAINPFLRLKHFGLGSVYMKYRISSPDMWEFLWGRANSGFIFYIEGFASINDVFKDKVLFTITRVVNANGIRTTITWENQFSWWKGHKLGFGYETGPIQFADDLPTLIRQAETKLKEFLTKQRQQAIQKVNAQGPYAVGFNQSIAKIDANLQLLNAFCMAAGFQPEELRTLYNSGEDKGALWDSSQVVQHLQDYLKDGTYDTPLPMPLITPQLNGIRESLIAKVNPNNVNYFQNNCHLHEINALVTELELLKQIQILALVPEIHAAYTEQEHIEGIANNTKHYQEGLEAGESIAIAFIIAALENAHFTQAAAILSENNPDIFLMQDSQMSPTLKQGLLQAFSLKVMEIAPQLIAQGQDKAGIWLLTHAQGKIKQLLTSEQPLSLGLLATAENESFPARLANQATSTATKSGMFSSVGRRNNGQGILPKAVKIHMAESKTFD